MAITQKAKTGLLVASSRLNQELTLRCEILE